MTKLKTHRVSALQNKKETSLIGRRVELICTDDPYSRLPPGERGTVEYVDDTGTVFVRWDSGSGLGLIPGVDQWSYL